MKIAIASGKGGTGKSTVAVNLAYYLSQSTEKRISLLDCDVEEPNCHIFLKPTISSKEKIFLDIPEVNNEKCTGCGKCIEICQFNSLALVKNKVMVFPELCHSCSGCWLVCTENAINKSKREIGKVYIGKSGSINFIYGKTKIGEPMSPPLINAVKQNSNDSDIEIIDCPPGTSCPMIAGVQGSDYVLLVTEPTPFGLYDLKLAVDVVKKLSFKFGIVINKSSYNDHLIEDYTEKEGIEIVAKLQDSRLIANVYSKGEIILEKLPEYKEVFKNLDERISSY